jgi:hypothetical protein
VLIKSRARRNTEISDVEVAIEGRLYTTEVKAHTVHGRGSEADLEKIRIVFKKARASLSKHFKLKQHSRADGGFIGLVLISPDNGKAEVALVEIGRSERYPIRRVIATPRWLAEVFNEKGPLGCDGTWGRSSS